MVYKNKEDVGYCYLARRMDATELFYHVALEGILDYVDKTIKKL